MAVMRPNISIAQVLSLDTVKYPQPKIYTLTGDTHAL